MADPSGPVLSDESAESARADVTGPSDGVQGPPADTSPSFDVDGRETESSDGLVAEDDLDDDDEPTKRRVNPITQQVRIDSRVLIALVLVVAIFAGAYVYTHRPASNDTAADPPAGKTPPTTAFKLPKDFRTFVDPEAGIKLSFPKDWEQHSTSDLPDKALRLVAGPAGTGDSISVRVIPYASEVTAANIDDQKNVFDALFAPEKIKVFVNQKATVAGLTALFYVYEFNDEATGKAGIHAHYFVFQGKKMVSLIFQALPGDRYKLLAPVFDTIAASLKVTPADLPESFKATPATTSPTTAVATPPTSAP